MSARLGVTSDPFELASDSRLTPLFLALERRVKVAMRTAAPCTVTAFYPGGGALANPAVDVLVGNLSVHRLEDPSMPSPGAILINPARREVTLKPTELKMIPVEFPGTTFGRLTFPIVPGDTGVLQVLDRNPTTWLRKGAPTDPVDMALAKLPFSVFRPGLRSLANALGAVDQTAVVLDGDTLIKIGAGSTDFIALAAKVLTELQAIKSYIDTHTHLVPGAVSGGPGITSNVPTSPMPTPSSVAATKAMAE